MSETQPEPLTARQATILATIKAYIERHGYPPSVREVAAAVGARSYGAVGRQIGILGAKGYLRRVDRKARMLVLVEPGTVPCETCRGTGTVPAGAA